MRRATPSHEDVFFLPLLQVEIGRKQKHGECKTASSIFPRPGPQRQRRNATAIHTWMHSCTRRAAANMRALSPTLILQFPSHAFDL